MQTVQTQIRQILKGAVKYSLIRVYTVCHLAKYFKKQLHKKQKLSKKVWNEVFEILGKLT